MFFRRLFPIQARQSSETITNEFRQNSVVAIDRVFRRRTSGHENARFVTALRQARAFKSSRNPSTQMTRARGEKKSVKETARLNRLGIYFHILVESRVE